MEPVTADNHHCAIRRIESDRKIVEASDVRGTIKAPPSKNEMIRVVAASLLSEGQSSILNPSISDDALVALDIAVTLGADIRWERQNVLISGNKALQDRPLRGNIIHCGGSGLCMRLFAPIAALTGSEFTIDGFDTVDEKPMHNLERLNIFGVKCETNKGFAPLWVRGKLKASSITIENPHASQLISGLLLSLPLCNDDSAIKMSPLVDKPHIEMTVDILKKFGIIIPRDKTKEVYHIQGNQTYRHCTISIDGDWSCAAFLLVAGSIAGSITVTSLNTDTDQAEKAILYALSRAGADIEVRNGSVFVQRKHLNAINFDARQCPGLIFPLAALSAHCEGTSIIHGTESLQIKDSERVMRLASEFASLGIKLDIYQDRIEIHGGIIKNAEVNSRNDDRVAMACAVAALRGSGEVSITNPHCVTKSYPSFFDDLESIKIG